MGGFYLDSVVEAERRINHPNNLLTEAKYKTIGQGQSSIHSRPNRKEYRKLSPETKGLVAALAQVSGVKETSEALGIHRVTVSALKNGMTTSGKDPDPEVRKQTESVLDRIGSKASDLVQESLARLLNPARLADAKTSELANIAGIAMSIVEKTQPKTPNTFIAGRVVFMVPPSRNVDQYDVIDVDPVRE